MENNKKKLKLRERVLAFVVERSKPKLLFPIIVLCVLAAALAVCSYFDIKSEKEMIIEYSARTDNKDDIAKISFAGDIVLGRNVATRANRIGYDVIFNSVQNLWRNSDFIVANLDTCVLDKNVSEYEDTRINKKVCFSTNSDNLKYIRDAGINVLSIATDHIADYGRQTVKTAIDTLDQLNVAHVGAGEDREKASAYEILTVDTTDGKTIKIALFGALGHQSSEYGAKAPKTINRIQSSDTAQFLTDNSEINSDNTYKNSNTSESVNSDDSIINNYDPWAETAGTFSGKNAALTMNIAEARQVCDVIVVYMHWGDDAMFYENSTMRSLAYNYIDAGADVVIGTNPRVILPIETYKRGIIFYSIGSLVYDSAESRLCDSSMVDLIIDSNLNRTIEVTPLRIKSCIPQRTSSTFYTNRIFTKLTRNMDKTSYSISDNKLVIELGQKRPVMGD